MANQSYLSKLLTLLIKRSGGLIKIPLNDLVGDDVGQGFQVHFDKETRELVLSFVPAGTRTYTITEGAAWLTSEALPQPRQEPHSLTQEDLVLRTWTESAATPTNQESSSPKKNRVVQLTTEGNAEAELERRRASLLREIEGLQPPSRPHSPSPQPLFKERGTRSNRQTVFSRP